MFTNVNSSFIESVANNGVKLLVTLADGKVYSYDDPLAEKYEALVAAHEAGDSVGRTFNQLGLRKGGVLAGADGQYVDATGSDTVPAPANGRVAIR